MEASRKTLSIYLTKCHLFDYFVYLKCFTCAAYNFHIKKNKTTGYCKRSPF